MPKKVTNTTNLNTITISDDEIVPFVYRTGIVFNWINGAYRPARGQEDEAEDMGISRTGKYYRNRYGVIRGALHEWSNDER